MEGSGRKEKGGQGGERSANEVDSSTPSGQHGNLRSPYKNYKNTPRKLHSNSSTMTDHVLEVAETIQTASIVSNPSAAHDINPSTAASEKQPVVAAPASDAGSLSSDIVDPSRVIRPIRRRQTLPPLPDLRFEQSYLASIKDADTWGRVAWITVRDQVCTADESSKDENLRMKHSFGTA